jgi:hypothetical protein
MGRQTMTGGIAQAEEWRDLLHIFNGLCRKLAFLRGAIGGQRGQRHQVAFLLTTPSHKTLL